MMRDVLSDPERDKMIIESWIKENYRFNGKLKINDDLMVDCGGSVVIENTDIESLTNGLFRWGEVKGSFSCAWCEDLKTLEDGPDVVGGDFDCNRCKALKTLEGCPKAVDGGFYCNDCDGLKTLKGSPKEVGHNFRCTGCGELRSLKDGPEKVRDVFWCDLCKNLVITDDDRKKYIKMG